MIYDGRVPVTKVCLLALILALAVWIPEPLNYNHGYCGWPCSSYYLEDNMVCVILGVHAVYWCQQKSFTILAYDLSVR